jgi:hypothetical protein
LDETGGVGGIPIACNVLPLAGECEHELDLSRDALGSGDLEGV